MIVNPMMPALLLAQQRAMRATRFISAQSFDALAKADMSPVTAADFASQAVISMTLADDDATRSIPMLGEEDAQALALPEQHLLRERVIAAVAFALQRDNLTANEVLDAIQNAHCVHATSSTRFFTLDPVDGTKGFLRGGQYAIALALIEDGTPTLAALGCPHLQPFRCTSADALSVDAVGTLQFAERANGAFELDLRDVTADPCELHVAEWKAASAIRLAESVESAHSAHDESAKIFKALDCAVHNLRLDSQAKYALVARGDADLYMRIPVLAGYAECIWDHAAGTLIAQEAGARVCDLNMNALDFTTGARLTSNYGILCGDEELVTRILDVLRR
ncbi:MAG: 3'(2'),5'-bisphosphate nucleotidase [Phycisphaerales bacterium]|nr:3'(2'),5'-bisphosphate nucleotidase [Phycisphaerales bacterium]